MYLCACLETLGCDHPTHHEHLDRIPADAFESRISRNDPGTTRLEPIFWALRDSHQNMIRNWGGGIYQRDSFYDLADENGIMIWEDLMFACAAYAIPPEFLESAA